MLRNAQLHDESGFPILQIGTLPGVVISLSIAFVFIVVQRFTLLSCLSVGLFTLALGAFCTCQFCNWPAVQNTLAAFDVVEDSLTPLLHEENEIRSVPDVEDLEFAEDSRMSNTVHPSQVR